MAKFRIHRMKESARQHFRWAPHVSGAASVKAKDYEPDGEIEASGEYHAWSRLRTSPHPLAVGDLLESENGALRICKYVGFESAAWVLPEVRSAADLSGEQTQQPAPV
jgi:hypothetical protein